MPEQIYSLTSTLRRVAATVDVPLPAADTPDPTDAGVFAMTNALDFSVSSGDGSAPKVRLMFGKLTSGSYTLKIYGVLRVQDGGWVPILLFKATITADKTPGGTANSNAFGTGEKVAGAISVDAAVPAAMYTVLAAGSDGMSHVMLDVHGSPFLIFQTSEVEAFVLASPAS